MGIQGDILAKNGQSDKKELGNEAETRMIWGFAGFKSFLPYLRLGGSL